MSNPGFLQRLTDLQTGIMYDRVEDLGFAKLSYCQKDPSPFWNMALVNSPLTESELAKVENKLKALDCKPAIYFEHRNDLMPLIELLEQKGYKKTNEDSWMFYEDKDIDMGEFKSVRKVNTEEELTTFLDIFNQCYQGGDPQNPYGELGEYLIVAEESWREHHATDRVEYFLAYKNDHPVAVSTLTNFSGLGYISNVGSLRSVRGEGYGKAATLHCVQVSKERGNDTHCIATEEGTYPNEFYKRIGFKTRFRAPLFVKD